MEAGVDHAAGLGFLPGYELGVGMGLGLAGETHPDVALASGALRLGRLGLGAGASLFGEDELDGSTSRVDLAAGLRVTDTLALGTRWTSLRQQASKALDNHTSVSASLTWRPIRHISAGLAWDRLHQSQQEEGTFHPMVHGSLGLRPGTERVAFGAEAGVATAGPPDWYAGASLRFMPMVGLTVGGYGRFGRGGGDPDRIEWGGYLALSQDRVEVEAAMDRREPAGDEGAQGTGLSVAMRTTRAPRPTVITRSHGIARVDLRGPIPERPPASLFASSARPFGHLLATLDVMGRDPDLDGVLIDIAQAPRWGQSWELRQAMGRLKAAGKRVYARIGAGNMRTIYLASAADRIFVHPAGSLRVSGLALTTHYLAAGLSRLGIRAQFARWAEYKSAPEPLLRDGPSEPAKEQTVALLDAFVAVWREAVGEGRALDGKRLDEVLATGIETAQAAHARGLVDRAVPDDGLEDAISEDLGHTVHVVRRYRPHPRAWNRWGPKRRIAVVAVVGTVVNGRGSSVSRPVVGQTTGDRDVAEQIGRAVKDDSVVGIIVRVDSPGGSVLASDRMHRVVSQAAEKKPVVVSFGDVAASGGYYLACGAPTIVASPLTITGSIGVFAGKIDLSGLHEKIGVSTWTHRTAPHADVMGSHRPWTEEERVGVTQYLESHYDRFLMHVAAGRGLTREDVADKARGRVYAGKAAIALGLVDRAGSLWDAMETVRREAGIDPDESVDLVYPGPRGVLAGLRQAFAVGEVEAETPESITDAVQGWLAWATELADDPIQARMPFVLQIE